MPGLCTAHCSDDYFKGLRKARIQAEPRSAKKRRMPIIMCYLEMTSKFGAGLNFVSKHDKK